MQSVMDAACQALGTARTRRVGAGQDSRCMRSDPCEVRTSRLGDVGNNQNSSKAPVRAVTALWVDIMRYYSYLMRYDTRHH
jgi:hypothetical protein